MLPFWQKRYNFSYEKYLEHFLDIIETTKLVVVYYISDKFNYIC